MARCITSVRPNDILNLVNRENGIWYTTHPRTKNTAGYPDGYRNKDFFLSDRNIGASWESLPVDLSEKRLCEVRCFGVMDDSSNWAPKPKYMLAEGDTYTKWPDDETYPQLSVNYIKLDRVPSFKEGWGTVIDAMRTGNFFGTTGEVLFHNYGVSGSGARPRLHGQCRMDLSAGIRGAGLERRQKGRSPDHSRHRDAAFRIA